MCVSDYEGFVGCIRNLRVQGQLLDALDLVQTKAASGLIIDGCNITDYCRGNSMCKHGGVCLSEWTGVACDCTSTHYTGHACHFCKYHTLCSLFYAPHKTFGGHLDLHFSILTDVPKSCVCNLLLLHPLMDFVYTHTQWPTWHEDDRKDGNAASFT